MKIDWTRWLMVALVLVGGGCGLNGSRPDGSGTIECTQVRVAPEVSGRLATLAVAEGDAVSNGQVVARLDPAAYDLKRAEARAAHQLADQELKRINEVFAKNSATQRQVDEATAMADQARARLALAEKAVADCVVRAPAAGMVTTKSAEEGEVVSAGTPLLTLSRLDEVWLSVYIPEPRLAGIKVGGKASVKVDGRQERISGVVTYLSPVAEFSPKNVQTAEERAKLVYRVKITLKNKDGLFKPGMPADAWLEIAP